jgi:hypothetical protein
MSYINHFDHRPDYIRYIKSICKEKEFTVHPHDPNIDKEDNELLDLLFALIDGNDYVFMEFMMIRSLKDDKSKCLMKASSVGNIELMKLLVDYGADPYWKDEVGNNIMHYARNPETIRYAYRLADSRTLQPNNEGEDALFLAIKQGKIENIKILDKLGFKFDNRTNIHGQTLVDVANPENRKLIEYLIKKGLN